MASNKRLLKKEIRNICGALAGECVIAKITVPGINPETLNKIIYELAELQENAYLLNFPSHRNHSQLPKNTMTPALNTSRLLSVL